MPASPTPAAPASTDPAARGSRGPRGEGVAVVLVSHDGQRWLPTVLEGLAAQTRPPDRVVAVDTGSKDESANLLEAALSRGRLGQGEVVRSTSRSSFPDAVRAGLERLAATGAPPEWIWLLHDDSTPAPDALAELLAAAQAHPQADVLGPKLREWPSLRRLLELGVSISGTGQRETGLERGEYDQGQHDDLREVLAVNTAGMLVRRDVLVALDGFDPSLPVFGNDVDFGWRAAAAGRTTLVVPSAVVFHAEAAHRGVRRTPLTGRRTHYQERRASLWTLLANASRGRLGPLVVRLVLGTLLRMLGFLLVRSPGEALDDLAALVSVLSRPGDLRSARARRRSMVAAASATSGAEPDRERVRRLLPPWWLPYRHGLDAISDLVAALSNTAADVAERRRAAAAAADPSSMAVRRVRTDEDDDLADVGVLARLVTNPVAVLTVLSVIALVVAARDGVGAVSGGALSPAPDSVGRWWSLYLESWHPLAQGTPVPAPAYLLPLALLASVLGPVGAVSIVLVAAAPVAMWGAWRFLRVVGRLASDQGASRWLLLGASTAYAVLPLASGAWGAGRLGPVVAAALLPWVAHATLGFADPEVDRRWRAAWRAGLLLALTTCFTPLAWVWAVLLATLLLALALSLAPSVGRARSTWGPPATALATVPVLLAPWWVPLLVHGASAGLLLDAGRPLDPATGGVASGADAPLALVLGRVGDPATLGAPWWLGVVPLVLAVLALVPRASRPGVLGCWVVALATALMVLLVAPVRLGGDLVPGTGFLLVAWQGCLVVAVVLGAQGALASSRRTGRAGDGVGDARPGRARRASTAVLALAAVAVPVGGLGWSLVLAGDELVSDPVTDVPAYMVQSAMSGPERGVLVIRGSVQQGLTYAVLRDDGVGLGEDEVLALAAADPALDADVTELVSRPRPAVVQQLAGAGLEYVVMPAPADGSVAAGLDATDGLVQASAENRETRAWRVDEPLDPSAVDGPGSWWRGVLLVLQALAVLTVLVLALPTTRARRP